MWPVVQINPAEIDYSWRGTTKRVLFLKNIACSALETESLLCQTGDSGSVENLRADGGGAFLHHMETD